MDMIPPMDLDRNACIETQLSSQGVVLRIRPEEGGSAEGTRNWDRPLRSVPRCAFSLLGTGEVAVKCKNMYGDQPEPCPASGTKHAP